MGLKPLLSFSSGELDPILHDNVTLEKFNKGLETARNVMISKTGSILSRFSRAHFVKAKEDGEPIRIYSPPNSGILMEVGLDYIRVYNFSGTLLGEVSTSAVFVGGLSEDELNDIHFLPTGKTIYLFITTRRPVIFNYSDYEFVSGFSVSRTSFEDLIVTIVGPSTGYVVEYAVALVYEGEEQLSSTLTGGPWKRPITAGHSNILEMTLSTSYPDLAACNEMRVYRRPKEGGTFGYLGSTTNFTKPGDFVLCDFFDPGGNADFTNGIPSEISLATPYGATGPGGTSSKTGTVYQQRLLTTLMADPEGIYASRPGYKDNFYRDFPYDADSALKFKSGTTGNAEVLRMIDNDGLIVFTSVGIYVSVGLLSIDNVALEKKGSWVIDENVPPLAVPGGVFFVDKKTNGVRQFIFSQDIQTYESIEHSIFSNHLFKYKTIVSWAFQGGVVPIIIVIFSDGTFATFTYNYEHQMRAWTRHDSVYPIEEVAGTDTPDATFFVTNKGDNRYIEVSLPRYIPTATYVANPEADKINLNGFMDAIETTSTLVNDSLDVGDIFLLVPVVADTWDGNLTLTCDTSALFPVAGLGTVGTIFRFFDTTDKSSVDLEVVSRASDDQVVVKPSCTFPLAQASDFRMYETFNEITGLTHLEGENVSVMVDGYVVNSPNNDVENYTALTVTAGKITLPNSLRAAIALVGRPITADVKTLNITTVEQKPTMIESLSVDKLYIRLHESRGLYIDNKFPEEADGEKDGSSVDGMEDLDIFDNPDGYDIVGNRYKQPVSRRIEQTLQGSWNSSGKVSIRQVDPLHFEILSIIPDVEVLTRSNV